MTKEAAPKPSTTFQYPKKWPGSKCSTNAPLLQSYLHFRRPRRTMFLKSTKSTFIFWAFFLMQFCFSFNYYDSKTTAIQHDAFVVADLGEGPGHPPYF